MKLRNFSSPITEITRTPIIIPDDGAKKKEDNLMKKLAEKLITTAISNEEDKKAEEKPEKAAAKNKKNKKNLIYQDDDLDMYSTPPKKAMKDGASSRTPLSCVANTNTPKSRSQIPTSTPKNLINFNDENAKSVSRIPVSSARRLHWFAFKTIFHNFKTAWFLIILISITSDYSIKLICVNLKKKIFFSICEGDFMIFK